jgi:hypothetical protein
MSEINYFNFFTMHDDVAADARWVLMWHVLIGVPSACDQSTDLALVGQLDKSASYPPNSIGELGIQAPYPRH